MNNEQREFGAKIFAAFANPSRLHILQILSAGPASVNEIAAAAGLKQSITSQHLSALQSAGAVVCSPCGNMRIYSLRGPRIARILQLTEEFYQAHLENLKQLTDLHV